MPTACAYDSPSMPASATPVPSNAPASIRLTASSRTDYQTAVVATVLTADGRFVAGIPIGFSTPVGTVSVSLATTDANGSATTVVATPTTTMVTVTVGVVTNTIQVSGASAPTAGTPTPPIPTPTPSPTTPTAVINAPSTGTTNVAVTFGVSAPALGQTWTWSFGDDTTWQTTAFTTTHTYATAKAYTVTVSAPGVNSGSAVITVSSPAGSGTQSYTVTLTPALATVTVGTSTLLTAAVTAVNGAPAVTSYAWDCNGDGTTDFTTTAPVNTQTCNYPSTGSAVSRVAATNGSVTGSATTVITVNAAPLSVSLVPSLFTTTVGTSVTFTATVTSAGTVPTGLQWQWDDTSDGTIDFTDASHNSPNTRSTAYGSTGTKTMKVTVTDNATGRTASGTVTVTIS